MSLPTPAPTAGCGPTSCAGQSARPWKPWPSSLEGVCSSLAKKAWSFVWPGSHSKLVEVDGQGRITRSQTTLAGELIQSVARHTLIAASLPAELPRALDIETAEAGARATQGQGLERAAFLVRVAALPGTMSPEQLASFWVGAVVADDAGHLARHPILARSPPVWVGGREPLRSLYAR